MKVSDDILNQLMQFGFFTEQSIRDRGTRGTLSSMAQELRAAREDIPKLERVVDAAKEDVEQCAPESFIKLREALALLTRLEGE